MKTFERLLSGLLVICMLLAMIPAEVIAVDRTPSELSTSVDFANTVFYVDEEAEIQFTTTPNDDAGRMVVGSFEFKDSDGNDAKDAVKSLKYKAGEDWFEFWGDFGPATGFPMTQATSSFKVTFAKAGTYTLKVAMKTVKTAEDDDTFVSEELCSKTYTVTVSDHKPAKLTTDIATKAFKVDQPVEFYYETVANSDAGTLVRGYIEFSANSAIKKLEYLESKDGEWYEMGGEFGPESGFPVIDGRSQFRVTFAEAGEFKVTVSLKTVKQNETDEVRVVCSDTQTLKVAAKTKPKITTNIGTTFVVGERMEFDFTTQANDYANTMVLGGFNFSGAEGDVVLEYKESKNGQWYQFYGEFGPPATGFPLSDATSRFAATFNKPGEYTVTGYIKEFGGDVMASTEEITLKVLDKYKVNVYDANDSGDPKVPLEEVEVVEGNSTKITVEAKPGYEIKEITGVENAEIAADRKTAAIQVTPDSDLDIYVTFVKMYTVTVNTNGEGSVTADPELEGGVVTVETGTKVTVTATPDEGYRVSKVTINDGENETTEEFNEHAKAYSTELSADKDYVVDVTFARSTFNVAVETPVNGSITIDDEDGVATYGQDVTVTVKADDATGYRIKSVTVNGEKVTLDENGRFEITNITNDVTIKAEFVLRTYDISVGVTMNGKVMPKSDKVQHGGSVSVSLEPEAGYSVGTVKVNGVDVTSLTEFSDEKASFVIKNITEAKSIVVTFVPVAEADVEVKALFNASEAVRESGMLFVYKNDVKINFSTDRVGIRIYVKGQSEPIVGKKGEVITFEKDTVITKIELRYQADGELQTRWHVVPGVTEGNPLQLVIDKAIPTAVITPAAPNAHGYHNSNVDVAIEVNESGDYAGIASVDYCIVMDGNASEIKNLYTGDTALDSLKRSITVDATEFNSPNVVVRVTVTDRAGNTETYESEVIKINSTAPVLESIKVIEEETKPESVDSYYFKRTIQLVIIDRNDTFDKEAAIKGVSIKAVDVKGGELTVAPSMVSCFTEGNKHTLTIDFSMDAKYEWSVGYMNLADMEMIITEEVANPEGVKNLYSFTVDAHAPTGEIKYESTTWNKLVETLTFGIWKNNSMTVTAELEDPTSLTQPIVYYKSNTTEALKEAELEQLYKAGEFREQEYTIDTDQKFTVYARFRDYAGNVAYISTNGMVYDSTQSIIEIIPEPANDYNLYNHDVKVQVTVSDLVTENVDYAGIKSIDYKVIKDGDTENPTQSGNLYTFNIEDPTFDQLKATWSTDELEGEKYINVIAEKNNSDDIKLVITVVDNAGNVTEKECPLSINIDELSATLSFEEKANKIVDGRGYFSVENRVGTLTIINDRGSSFNAEAATAGIKITAVDPNGNTVEDAYTIGEWVSNGKNHTCEITFTADAIYTWSFEYTNKADNALNVEENLSTEGSDTPFAFTVDDVDPTGKVTIENKTFETMIEVLTFGLYSQDSFTIVTEGKDVTSPVVIQYYKTDSTTLLSGTELDGMQFVDYDEAYVEGIEQEKTLVLDGEEHFTVYMKISDYAGNYIYMSSDGAIIDKTAPVISFTPDEANENGVYGLDHGDTVNVQVAVEDPGDYSGIKSVEWWIEMDGNAESTETEYSFNETDPVYTALVNERSFTIPVDMESHNSSNVEVHVKVVDNAGNEYEAYETLNIDVTSPAISISYDDNDARNEMYFDNNRTATIVITERDQHFNADDATAGITITAEDVNGQTVQIDPASMISGWTTSTGSTADTTTHTATISYTTDAKYTFAITYTDAAGNTNTTPETGSSAAPYEFVVDKVAPTGTVTAESEEGRVTTWDDLVNDLTFGFWSGKKITITGTSADVTSPIESVQYYKTSADVAMTEEELDAVTDWTAFDTLEAIPNEQLTVYLKITDNAGNVKYISTDGLIVDDTAPREEAIAPEITINPEQPVNDIYRGNVNVDIEVIDPTVGGTYAGLRLVTYRVLNMGVETQSGELYKFEGENPVRSDLRESWTDRIVVDSTLNNSNDVVIEVYAEDNAGNTSKDSVSIKIDTTAPTIQIRYNNNQPSSGFYYNANRTATITITERNFDAKDIIFDITNTDKKIPELPAADQWTFKEGEEANGDGNTYTATITFAADGDYEFFMAYTDLAGWTCGNMKDETYDNKVAFAAGTQNSTSFTIDKTNPVVRVSYNNNDAENGKYFNALRTATVTIIEHNFDVEKVNFTRTATRGGEIPTVAWNHMGDTHVATISYTTDGDYTFNVTMTDLAANACGVVDFGTSVAGNDFVIDTTYEEMITIGGVESGKAYGYGADVLPTLDISDINLDDFTVTMIGVQMYKTIDLTEEANKMLEISDEKVTGIFDIFNAVQDKDGIYTLTVTSRDKAGNEDSENIVFTVNRFGSVYAYDQYLLDLIADGGAYVQAVTNDLVIMEYNADKLVGETVEITRDGKPLDNVIYNVTPEVNTSVAVGENGWYQYKYTISKDNFASDGVYKISVSSKDATGNTPENNRYEDMGIAFRVDSTLPEISSIVGLEEAIVNTTELAIKYTVYDTMGLKSILVYVDGETIAEITDFSADINNYSGSFALGEKSHAQNVRIVVEDLAGNITDTDAETFSSAYVFNKSVTVSTSAFVRWYANKPLFWGSVGGTTVAAGGLLFILSKNRKKREEQAAAK